MEYPAGIVAVVFCTLQLSVVILRSVASVTEEDVKKLQSVFSEIERENMRLTSECDFLKQENAKLWTEANRLAAEVRDLQQFTRIDNIEITGIPQRPGEDVYDILRKLCDILETAFDREEISEAHRLPKGKLGHPFIVVRFISRRTRDRWLNASKTHQCNVQQIIPDAASGPVFINRHLTSFKKSLLDMGKRLVNEGVYAYAWVRDGKVYVRRTPTSAVIRVRRFEDFDRLNDSKDTYTQPVLY